MSLLSLLSAITALSVASNELQSPSARIDESVVAVKAEPRTPGKSCSVHLVELANQSQEHSYACSEWFQPAVNRYLIWLERPGEVSRQSILRYAGERSSGPGFPIQLQMFPAGKVRLVARKALPSEVTFRVIELEQPRENRAFDRRLMLTDATSPIAVPAGPVIAGTFDARDNAVTVSRPLTVRAGETLAVEPVRVAPDKAHALTVLRRKAIDECHVDLRIGGSRVAPGAVSQSDDRIVAVWYDIPAPGQAQIELTCNGRTTGIYPITLRPGEVTTHREVVMDSSAER